MATLSLHTCTVEKTRIIINRIHNLFHFPALLAVLYYRILHILLGDVPLITWGLITTAEVVFGFLWILSQAFEWWPVTRTTYPENIPVSDNELPGVDVFVCMADPKKEPILDIMNTVVSAMALDYPPEKLAVYLSDDSGTSATLCAIKEACSFARCWLPFCRKYGIKTRCPDAYFSRIGDDERVLWSDEFRAEEDEMKSKYKLFKQNVEKANGSDVVNYRPPCVEVIHDNRKDGMNNSDEAKIPLLVYVSREKRPSHPHRFKAGALNALLRISGIMSNGPYLLVLDCDMYCNDPTSARQSMCFHLDPKISPSIAFVQYPQMFYNLSKNDIYDNQSRSTYMLKWQGMDGIGGPYFTGSGYYLKRKALYGTPNHEDAFLREPEKNFGFSSKFISSLKGINQKHTNNEEYISDAIVDEARNLATCTFEKGTEWGQEVGYSYSSLLESTSTGYLLHCRGWRSVYLYPNRPCFLGCATIDMHDGLVQIMKWSSGLTQVAFSGFSPLTYGVSRMSLIQSMCYGFIMFSPLYSIPNWLYGTIPQMCLLSGIHLYPKVSSPWFIAFATVYVSSISQHLFEVFFTGGSMRTWWNEYRIRPIRSVTALFFGVLDVVMKRLGVVKANFRLTNKTIDKDKMEKYKRGKFDFQGADMFVVPLRILAILNLVCFIGGLKRVVFERNLEDLFVQVYISSMTLAISYPILEELIPKKGR